MKVRTLAILFLITALAGLAGLCLFGYLSWQKINAGFDESLVLIERDLYAHTVREMATTMAAFVIAAVVLAAFGLLTFIFLFIRIDRPLKAFRAAIGALRDGDLDARVEVRHNDEFGELAESFNDMVEIRAGHEAELAESEQRFRQLAESIDEVFWLSDRDNRKLIYVSPAYERIWGRSRDELYAHPERWLEALHPEDYERVRQVVSTSDAEFNVEFRIIRPDGTLRWAVNRSFPIYDGNGELYRRAGVATDITERQRTQLQLNERVKELRSLYRVLEITTLESLPLGEVCERLVECLPPAFQYPEMAVARVSIHDEETRSPDWEPPAAVLKSRVRSLNQVCGLVEVGYTGQMPDEPGGEGPFVAEERELLDGVALHIENMLEQRKTAEQLARTERLNAVGNLTGGIAHDFNNLLTVILGNSETLIEELGEHPRHGPLVHMVEQAARRGGDLTRRLLAFARRQPLEPRKVDVNELVAGMDQLLRSTLGGNIEMEVARSAGLWSTLVDPSQLENALLNLCINARDSISSGGRLTIETANVRLDRDYADQHTEVTPGQYVMLSVSDTGTGIADEHLARIFEPFYTTKPAGEGTGLGLSMVYGFVKQSGGHIKLYSEPGHGTSVKIYLPRHFGDVQKGQHSKIESTAAATGEETILLVEDDDLVRTYTHTQLTWLGYRVIECADGPGALKVLEGNAQIDLLFTDVVMPGGMNGRELADRAAELRPGLKVLFTSGYTENAIIHHGRLDADAQILQKPHSRADLAKKIREVLESG